MGSGASVRNKSETNRRKGKRKRRIYGELRGIYRNYTRSPRGSLICCRSKKPRGVDLAGKKRQENSGHRRRAINR